MPGEGRPFKSDKRRDSIHMFLLSTTPKAARNLYHLMDQNQGLQYYCIIRVYMLLLAVVFFWSREMDIRLMT